MKEGFLNDMPTQFLNKLALNKLVTFPVASSGRWPVLTIFNDKATGDKV